MLYILLIIIAIILWKIYRQKEDEKENIINEKAEIEWEQNQKNKFKNYPNLIGNVDYTWLDLFGGLYVEKGLPHLNAAFMMYLKESNNTERDMIEVDHIFDSLWDLTEELLEHLEQYHDSSKYEYEIAILTYWQIISEKADTFKGKDFETIKKIFQSSPFTDIQKIPSWFPQKTNHTNKEITFVDKYGVFPRESNGSVSIHKRISV